jgi:hypothetical protein
MVPTNIRIWPSEYDAQLPTATQGIRRISWQWQSAYPCGVGLLLNQNRILSADGSIFMYVPVKTFQRVPPKASPFVGLYGSPAGLVNARPVTP